MGVDMSMRPVIWMVRPWINDFSAFDHFSQSPGFLALAGNLREAGCDVCYIDCLANASSQSGYSLNRKYKKGDYLFEIIDKPDIFAEIPRFYKRYGISPEHFREIIQSLPKPHAVLLTTGMTYWYVGVQWTIQEIKAVHPDVRVGLGGVYATLCSNHAKMVTGADCVFRYAYDDAFFQWLSHTIGKDVFYRWQDRRTLPAWDLVKDIDYVILSSSHGCLHRCRYCATPQLNTSLFTIKPPECLEAEIQNILDTTAIRSVALYDDDLASRPHLLYFLRFLEERRYPLKWQIPNAISASAIDLPVAELLVRCGFEQPRLSVNYLDDHLGPDGLDDQTLEIFERASVFLQRVGYPIDRISCYLIAGLPNQTLQGLKNACDQLLEIGIRPYPVQYSPIPGTPLGDLRLNALGYAQSGELLLTNKLLSVFRHPGWTGQEYYHYMASLRVQPAISLIGLNE